MIELNWKPLFYNGIETNIEVSNCCKIRRINKCWSLKNSKTKFGIINIENFSISKSGYRNGISVQVKNIGHKTLKDYQIIASVFLDYKFNEKHRIVIDHIDSNKLNYLKNNLRLITNRENCSKEKTKKSGLPAGVSWSKSNKKYQSKIHYKKQIHLGFYNDINSASNAYQNKIKEITYGKGL
jgi:hypothetical protein